MKTFFILVAGRRPETVLDDENADESLNTLQDNYEFLRRKCHIPVSQVFLLLFNEEQLIQQNPLIKEAAEAGTLRKSAPDTFIDLLTLEIPKISPNENRIVIFLTSHGQTDKSHNDDYQPIDLRGLEYFSIPRKKDSRRWWISFPYASSSDINRGMVSDPSTSEWVFFPNQNNQEKFIDTTAYSLHWEILADTFKKLVSGKNPVAEEIIGFFGCCYSGGLFQNWLPEFSLDKDQQLILKQSNKELQNLDKEGRYLDKEERYLDKEERNLDKEGRYLDNEEKGQEKEERDKGTVQKREIEEKVNMEKEENLSIYIQCSATPEYAAATWFWYQIREELEKYFLTDLTLSDLYLKLHSLNPVNDFSSKYPEYSRGELSDAIATSQFYGNAKVASVKLKSLFQ